ncbi:helix-turn-helix domain-containing protein [Larkinella punicea]|uniref:AraC family transcriptional regulator n=1 Tax=Larkinella punicea TaxID=2315727 RepID=A0A368JN33_9BACT|nr:helix-turn-helix domain-containing protein [Larkinella punicea]RCR68446.1 AraC family transcriptional regulator [Larkinella punicea]
MYQQYAVPEALQPYVSFFYSMETRQTGPVLEPELLMPSGTCILGMQYKGNWRVISPAFNAVLTPYYLCGQQTHSYSLIPLEPVCGIVGVSLKPTALWKWFDIPIHRLTNHAIAASSLFGVRFNSLIARYERLTRNEERVALLTDFLLDFVAEKSFRTTVVDAALDEIYKSKGCLTTAEICRRIPVSERYLQMLFKNQVGVSPSAYARMIRFSHIFLEYRQQKEENDLVFITALYNYYDASHFNKDFKKVFGVAPTAFQLRQFRLLLELIDNGPYLTMVSASER